MKKIININFHGRVVPIEETAYDILKQYIDSLRSYFANEEGRDEIINDIENRFAELFSERLQRNQTCITDDDVNAIIQSMGRPEDFEKEESTPNGFSGATAAGAPPRADQARPETGPAEEPRRLYRSENDRVLGGVCGGLAAYLRIDPAIVRIIFALITFGGFGSGLLIYIILWIVLPSRSIAQNFRKRLYRNPDNRVIAGVASGLAAYFHVDVWIPRLIFAFPLILGIITSLTRRAWFDFDPAPIFVTGGFGGTLFITYIILWVVLPEAVTASEKLEMRGEKVDLESIKNTVKSDLEGFRSRAGEFGNEVKDRAKQFGTEFKQATQQFAAEAGPAVKRTGTGIGHAIGVLFKAFFLFVAGVIAFALVMALIGLLFSGMGVLPFRNYLLNGFWENALAWLTLVLFLGTPIIALLVWLIRRIMGVRSRNNYLGYIFGSLWVIGVISFIALVGSVVNNFRTKASVESDVTINQPAQGKMVIKTTEGRVNYYGSDFFGFDWNNDAPFYSLREDSVMMKTVRIDLAKSTDSFYHVRMVRFSHGNNPVIAQELANRIQFPINQKDSVLYLPQGFAITPNDKFRNQQVLVIVDVPVGKRIFVDANTEDYRWFNVNVNRRHRGWDGVDWNEDWGNSYPWENNVEYIMTNDGLQRTGRYKESGEDQDGGSKKEGDEGYRYKPSHDTAVHHPKMPPKTEKKPAPESSPVDKRTTENDSQRESILDRSVLMTMFTFSNSF